MRGEVERVLVAEAGHDSDQNRVYVDGSVGGGRGVVPAGQLPASVQHRRRAQVVLQHAGDVTGGTEAADQRGAGRGVNGQGALQGRLVRPPGGVLWDIDHGGHLPPGQQVAVALVRPRQHQHPPPSRQPQATAGLVMSHSIKSKYRIGQ